MNNTNRFLNRFFLAIVGVLLLVAAAVAVALATVSKLSHAWKSVADQLEAGAQDWVAAPSVGSASLLTLGIALVAAVLAVLLLIFAVRQGRGHTGEALRRAGSSSNTVIDLQVAKTLLESHFASRNEFVGTRISAYDVQGTPMLKISARCRRGVSPRIAGDVVADAVAQLESIIGTEIPALIQLSGGFRARTSAPTRLLA